jgi:hypothetical protein
LPNTHTSIDFHVEKFQTIYSAYLSWQTVF